MRALLLAVVVTVSGCSFAFTRVPHAPLTADDCSAGAPVVDTLLAGLAAGGGRAALVGLSFDRGTSAGDIALSFGPAVVLAASAVFGFVQVGRCRSRLPGR